MSKRDWSLFPDKGCAALILVLALLMLLYINLRGASSPASPPSSVWWVIGWTNPADTGLADYVALIAGGDSLMAERILLHAEQDEKLITGERFGRPVIVLTRAAWLAAGNPDVGQSEVVRVRLQREGSR